MNAYDKPAGQPPVVWYVYLTTFGYIILFKI